MEAGVIEEDRAANGAGDIALNAQEVVSIHTGFGNLCSERQMEYNFSNIIIKIITKLVTKRSGKKLSLQHPCSNFPSSTVLYNSTLKLQHKTFTRTQPTQT